MPTTTKGIPTPSDAIKISQLAQAMREMGDKIDLLLPPGISGNSLSAGPVPANSNLDTWLSNSYAGFWEIGTAALAATITGLPTAARVPGSLLHLPGIGAQLWAPYTQPASLYYRAVVSITGKLWNTWRRLLTDDDVRGITWNKGSLPNGTDYRSLPPGAYLVATAAIARSFAPALPFAAAGDLTVHPGENYGRRVEFSTFGSGSRPNQVWQCERSAAGVWSEWKQTNAAVPMKYALAGGADLDTLAPGFYWVQSLATAQLIPGLPAEASGDYIVYPGAYPRHEWITTGLSSRPNEKWQRETRGDGTFSPWWKTDGALRMGGSLAAGTDLDTLAPGFYTIRSYATAQQIKGLPAEASGDYIVYPGAYPRHEWITTGLSSRPNEKWQRETRGDGTFSPWWKTDGALRMGGALSGSADLDTLAPGFYWVQSYAMAQLIKGLPAEASGDYIVYPGAYPRHEWITTGLNSRPNEKWQREKRGDGTFTPWWRTDIRAVEPAVPVTSPAAPGSTASGFKVVPLSVTLDGNGGASKTVRTAREERLPMIWHAPITRFRVHIGNQNLRSNERSPGALNITGLWIGQHAGNGAFKQAPRHLQTAFKTPADGSEWVSKWHNYPLQAGSEYLLNFGLTAAAGTEFFYHNGQSYASDNPANAGQIGHGAAGTARSLLDVWIEAETYATTPVIATVGSSSSAGVGADFPAQQNLASLVAARLKALPVHYGGAGDTMGNAANFGWDRWTRWQHLAKPDAVINFMGSNDVFETGMTLATLKARYNTLTDYLAANITANIYATTVTARTTVTGAQETMRREYNQWLQLLPGNRDVFDLAAVVSADDETVAPEYDSGDGYHFNTAGHLALASAISRPITTPPVLYATI